jgi:hemerythrin
LRIGGFKRSAVELPQFTFFLARLEKLMRTHFDHEVELMEEAAGRMCNCNGHKHQMLLSLYDQASGLSRFNWKKTRSLPRTKLPKLVREHNISMIN